MTEATSDYLNQDLRSVEAVRVEQKTQGLLSDAKSLMTEQLASSDLSTVRTARNLLDLIICKQNAENAMGKSNA